jgi:hypothetical protein
MKMYMWVATQIVGNPADWSYDYSRHGEQFADRQRAIRDGWRQLGHDDFNIATIDGGKVVAFGFDMDDFKPEDCDDLDAVTAAVLP